MGCCVSNGYAHSLRNNVELTNLLIKKLVFTYVDNELSSLKEIEPKLSIINLALEKLKIDRGIMTSINSRNSQAVNRPIFNKFDEFITVKDFGAVGDGIADDTVAINNAMRHAANTRVKLRVTKGTYKITGYILTHSNLHMSFDTGAWIMPHAWSRTGAVLTNVSASPSTRIQENIVIENPQMDGQFLPYHDNTMNDNAIGFARGASKVKVIGGHIRNFKYSFNGGGGGGKAINFEGGVLDSCTEGTLIAENCSVGIFVQASEIGPVSRIQIGNLLAINCESSFIALGIDIHNDPDGNPNRSFVSVGDIMAYNCGHTPNRPVNGVSPQKSGIVVFGEAANVYINSIHAYNDDSYPMNIGYPTLDTGFVSAGLSGPVGSVIWGWGRNIYINNVTYHGNVDYLIYFGRARAVGEDSAPTTYPSNGHNFNINQFNHVGKAEYIFYTQPNMPEGAITGNIKNITVDDVSFIATSQLTRYPDIFTSITTKDNKKLSGRVSTLLAKGNNLKTIKYAADETNHRSIATDGYFTNNTIIVANDTVVSVKPEKDYGIVMVSSGTSRLNFLFSYRVTGVAQITLMNAPLNQISAIEGILTGTTGNVNDFTVGIANGNLFFENRRGGTITINLTFFG